METIPKFEYDVRKSSANLAKHGIDFDAVQALWRDARRVEFDARSLDELRFAVIGAIDGKLWTVFATMRGERVRIISARRARDDEEKLYGQEMGERGGT